MKSMRFCATILPGFLTFFLSMPLLADSIELADGAVIEGDFVGSSNGIIMFNTGDGIEAYPEDQVVGVYFSSGVETASAQSSAPQTATISVPAGTRLVIRTIENVDTRQHSAGHRFRGQLEGALVVNGTTVAPSGTFVYGTIVNASQAGNVVGSSNLSIEFTDLMIDDVLFPIATTALKAQSQGEGGRTLRRSARGCGSWWSDRWQQGRQDGCQGWCRCFDPYLGQQHKCAARNIAGDDAANTAGYSVSHDSDKNPD